jgi:glycosyltransferase involved in cell wall biosynthesis
MILTKARDPVSTLVISTEMPVVPMTGGRIRTHHLARALARLGSVTIAGFSLEGEPACVLAPPLRTAAVPWQEPPLYAQMGSAEQAVSERAYELLANHVPEPWIASGYESAQLRETIRALCAADLDLVLLEHSLMGAYLDELPSHVPVVLDLHNVHSREAERAMSRELEDPSEAQRVRDFEATVVRRSTITIAVSEVEAAYVRRLVPGARVEVVPNGVDTEFFTPSTDPPSPGCMLFTGLMNYPPNVEAVVWFAAEILPLLRGGALHVVGSRPSEHLAALASQRLLIHGEVPDTRPFQWRAQVVVVPLRSGAGTRLKILEAAACGNAIVSTSLGAEGLDFVPGRDLLIADSPADFADAVDAVMSDDELRTRLGQNARRAAEWYRWELIGDRLLELAEPLRRHRRRVHAS